MYTQTIKYTIIKGDESETQPCESSILQKGRKIGTKPRIDIQLSSAQKPCTTDEIATMDVSKLSILLTDSVAAYIRRVKIQRLAVNESIELTFNYNQMLNILTSPCERSKKLISTSSIRALKLSSSYKAAVLATIAPDKRGNWDRLAHNEFYPLLHTTDASINPLRAAIRNTIATRMADIAVAMPDGAEQALLLAMSQALEELPVVDMSDSV
jgi:hypothetical protein